jgi:hypothetical protein
VVVQDGGGDRGVLGVGLQLGLRHLLGGKG